MLDEICCIYTSFSFSLLQKSELKTKLEKVTRECSDLKIKCGRLEEINKSIIEESRSTLMAGIQNSSAILPLLTEEQKEFIKSQFSFEDWRELHSLPHNKTNDATFIRKTIECMYKDELQVLLNRTLTGTRRSNHDGSTSAVTPEKRKIIRDAFLMRIDELNATYDDMLCRKNLRSFIFYRTCKYSKISKNL